MSTIQNKSTAPSDPGGGDKRNVTYANKVSGTNTGGRTKLNILDIFLERRTETVSYNLSKEELSRLLFKKMSIDPRKGVGRQGQVLSRRSWLEDNNFAARYIHGNRRVGIKLAHWNKGGGYLANKINEVDYLIKDYRPHVIGISESNFKSVHDKNEVQIENYNLFLANTLENPLLKISRVAVYVHQDVLVKVRHDLMNDCFSSIWLELGLPRQKKILVCNVYREWQYLGQEGNNSGTVDAQLQRWISFIDQWEKAISEEKEIHCLGDFNLNWLNWDSPSTSTLNSLKIQLFDRVIPHGFAQLVTTVTRTWKGQEPSCLDHHYTNHPEKVSNVNAYFTGASDHKIIIATRYTKAAVEKPRFIRKRSYKDFNAEVFVSEIRKIKWLELYLCENIELAVEIFTEKLSIILNRMAPVRVVQVRSKYAPWVSKETKDLIQLRNDLQKRASTSQSPEDWTHYREVRNQITSKIRKEKKVWQENKIKSLGNDSSSVWKNVKNWLGWTTGGAPTRLLVNGKLISKPKEVATTMNEFFIKKVEDIRKEIPAEVENPLDLARKIMRNRNCLFKFEPVHPKEVSEIIDNIKATKSCGLDEIDSSIIKLAKVELLAPITHLINLSILNQKFPYQWKVAKVIPLHKKDEVLDPKNYRPVSLLPILSKILERAVFCQIVGYLEDNSLLHPCHHGFRAKHNTTTALIQMYDRWVEAFEEKKLSAVVMLDLSAAFDVVDHSILLNKLKLYGFDEDSLSWLSSYLSDRSQLVYVDGSFSECLPVRSGVPQGSVLGPLLYILFTNDLPESIHEHIHCVNNTLNICCDECGSICCFADDSTITISNSDAKVLETKVNEKYKSVSEYMTNKRLMLNSDKTHLIIMTSQAQHKKNENFGIKLDTGKEVIEPVENEKLLGVHISNNFKWNNHIRDNSTSLFKLLTSRVNALAKISHIASFKSRKMIANGIVMSLVRHQVQLYGGSSDYLIKFIQVLQNKAARLVTKLGWGTPTRTLLSQCGWLSINQLTAYHSLILIFKVLSDQKPRYSHLKMSSEFVHRTRQATGGAIKETRIFRQDAGSSSFIPRTSKLWNSVPVEIRKVEKIDQFKKIVKQWVEKNVPI